MNFIQYLNNTHSIPSAKIAALESLVQQKRFLKGEDFVRAGQKSESFGFITTGLFRYYYTTDQGMEYTKAFINCNSILISYSAIIENRPSWFTIEALEDSDVEVLNFNKLRDLLSSEACWTGLLSAFLEKAFLIKEERERQLLLCSASERYQYFLQRFPGLEDRVRQHIIASYLGIAPESLSRLKKNITS